jgi:5-methylcytosine-specific restriction endonuclease McrA
MVVKMLPARVRTLAAKPIASLPTAERPRGSSWMRTRDRIMRRDNGLCRCDECRASGRLLVAHQVDHVIELADGGTNDDSNLRAINHDCHVRKTAASRRARGQTA